jgi:hypothetical protein
MALNETFRATVIMVGNAGTAFVFDYGYQDQNIGSTHLDMGTAAGDFQSLVQATLAVCLPAEVSFVRYRFACVGGTHVGEIGYVEVTPPVAGSIAPGVPLPGEIAISMKRSTGYSSRKDRGRVFFGPVDESLRSGTNPDECDVTNVDLIAINALGISALTTAGVLLKPVLLAGNGTTNGHVLVNKAIASVFVHHKSRRFRTGI